MMNTPYNKAVLPAAIRYSWEEIPSEWLNILAGKERIEELITNLQAKIYR